MLDEKELAEVGRAVRAQAVAVVGAWMIKHGWATGHGDTLDDLLTELVAQVTERARKLDS